MKRLLATSFFLPLLLASLIVSCESRTTVVHGITEQAANEIVVFLSSKNITATKVQSAAGQGPGAEKAVVWDITVPAPQADQAMAILSANGLPRPPMESLLDIFASGGLVPSEAQEEIRYRQGLAQEIASTIRKIDGVLDANVQLSFPQQNPLNPGQPLGKVTASVFVKNNGVLDDPNMQLIPKIKQLVAASVPGLSIDNVTVVSIRARFSEALPALVQPTPDQLQYVKVWGVVLSAASLGRFRALIYCFCALLLLLGLGFVWMWWKVHPLLHSQGGFKALFRIKPLTPPAPPAAAKPEEPAPTDKDAPKPPAPPPKQENVEGA